VRFIGLTWSEPRRAAVLARANSQNNFNVICPVQSCTKKYSAFAVEAEQELEARSSM
jgi:hypothetical protein